MSSLLLVLLAVLALPVFLVLLTIVVGSFEKILVWPYTPLRSPDHPRGSSNSPSPQDEESSEPDASIPITDHYREANLTAEQTGFRLLGAYRHGKGKMYRLRYNFWISPDRLVLAQTSTGTLAGIPMSITKFYTRLSDGRCLATMDQLKGRDSDLSGLLIQEVLTGAEFTELLDRHRRRIAAVNVPAVPYSKEDPLGDHRAFRTLQAERLAERGLVRFLDAERAVWKYSPRGATMIAVRPYLKQHRVKRGSDRGREVLYWADPAMSVPPPGDPPTPQKPGLLNQVELFFWIVLGVGAVMMFSRGPATNRAQALFRVGVSALGLIGISVVWVLKRSRSATPPRELGRPPSDRVVRAATSSPDEVEVESWQEDDSPDRA